MSLITVCSLLSLCAHTQNKKKLKKGLSVEGTTKGAYVVKDFSAGTPDIILIGTGSELDLAYSAAEKLSGEGVKARVVSFPCWELFEEQSAEYKESVLPKAVTKRVAVEAGCSLGWHKYVTDGGKFVGIDSFGASAPAPTRYEKFGITKDTVYAAAKSLL